MSVVYADTSALAKLILQEAGSSDFADLVAQADTVVAAAIGYVELRAMAASALRAGRVALDDHRRLMDAVERVWDSVSEIRLSSSLLRHAGDLAEQHRLRGYDAVHLAALTSLGSGFDLTFACWDDDLRRAASELGFVVFPIAR